MSSYMDKCNSDDDCNERFRMICRDNKCNCNLGDLFFEWPIYGCFVKAFLFGPCQVTGQCTAMNPNTYCNPDNSRCTCSPNYFYNGKECSPRYDGSNLKAQEVYKAAVVAAACFIVAVVGIFVACIVRRSFCRREPQLPQTSNREGDIFSISDEIAALRAVDKPPSYEEVLQIERTFYGIPPPEYSGPRNVRSSGRFHLVDGPPFSLVAGTPLTQPYNHEYSPPYLPSHDQQPSSSNFVTTADVRCEPSTSSQEPLIDTQPSTSSLSDVHVPTHLHRMPFTNKCASSSLPSSPYIKHCDLPIGKELLKQDSTSLKELPLGDIHSTPQSSLSQVTGEKLSIADLVETKDCPASAITSQASTPEHASVQSNSEGPSSLAYDNFAFESDIHV